MMEQEVVDYILQAQKHGLSDFEIKQNLLNVGWEATVVEDSLVFARASENKATSPTPLKNPVSTTSPIEQTYKASVQQPSEQKSSPAQMPAQKTPAVEEVIPAQLSKTDQSFNHPTGIIPKPFYKKPLLWASVVAVVIIGSGAFAYLQFASASPGKIWAKYLDSKKLLTAKADYTISYIDKNGFADSTSKQPFSFSLNGTSNSDYGDANNLKISSDLSAGIQSGAINYNVKFKYLLLGKILYLNLGQIDELKLLLGQSDLQWVKIDPEELKNFAKQNIPDFNANVPNFDSQKLQSDIHDIWSKANIAKPTDFLVKEKINGVDTYHLKADFDNQAFNTAVFDSMDVISKALATSTPQTLTSDERKDITAFLNKFKVKEFDIWVGQSDSQLYKVHMVLNAPSVQDLSGANLGNLTPGLGSAQSKSRDAKRLADIRQMASALEDYYNDNNGYPDGANGAPLNITPTYIGMLPVAPTPADGTCTDYYNSYWYSPTGEAKVVNGKKLYQTYTMTFCLGNSTGGYDSGIAQLSQRGIQSNIPCPTTADKCVGNNPIGNQNDEVVKTIYQMAFGGEFKFEATYSDLGKPQNIQAPASSTDILGIVISALGEARSKSRDAKRLADVRQFASGLELYFNDHNSYPKNIADLSPKYLGIAPTAPTPADGSCTDVDNTYSYTYLKNGQDYKLTFCLGADTGVYLSGTHSLSTLGIK